MSSTRTYPEKSRPEDFEFTVSRGGSGDVCLTVSASPAVQNEIYLFEIEIRIGPDTFFRSSDGSSPADQQLLSLPRTGAVILTKFLWSPDLETGTGTSTRFSPGGSGCPCDSLLCADQKTVPLGPRTGWM